MIKNTDTVLNEWKECKLGQIISVKHGYAFSGEFITEEDTGIRLVTPGNFHLGGGFKTSKFKYFRNRYPKEYEFSGNEIVVTMTDLSKESDTLGYAARIPIDKEYRYLHNQRVGLVQFHGDNICQDYIYWVMRSFDYHWFIVGSASGTSIMHTSPSRIEQYSFLLPSLVEQKGIANTLTSLDNKIDLLHRQNKTLEAIAETLFSQCFVEEADEKWEENSLLRFIDLIGGGTPKTDVAKYWDGDIHWLSGGDIATNHKSFIRTTEKNISESGIENSSAKVLPKFSTVISARGTVGKYCLLATPMAFSQSNYGILPRIKDTFFFTYLLISYVVEELQASAYGSVFDTITTNTFRDIKVRMPEDSAIKSFETSIMPYFSKMLLNEDKISLLRELRDTLLPKLMSGEVRVEV